MPSISSSIFLVTSRSTSWGEAPAHTILMSAVLKEMSGKRSTGMRRAVCTPATISRTKSRLTRTT